MSWATAKEQLRIIPVTHDLAKNHGSGVFLSERRAPVFGQSLYYTWDSNIEVISKSMVLSLLDGHLRLLG